MLNIEIGKMLKDARERKNLTQEQLAQKVGKKRSYIYIKTLVEIVEKGLGKKVKIEF
jgi:transcriptional regulator with XRE-family HTH domain